MKAREAHLVPLSTQALGILNDLKPVTGAGRLVFPSLRSRERPISNNTLNAALRRLGYSTDEMVAHGFRSMASTCLNEQGWHPDLIELQLAHAERNHARAAYNPLPAQGENAFAGYVSGRARGGRKDEAPFGAAAASGSDGQGAI